MADLFEYAAAPAPDIELNPEQRAAAHYGEGPLVVVAGAGTGKTRVITERIRYLLDTQPELTGKEILGLTFTDKAAAEMKHRVIAAARQRVGQRSCRTRAGRNPKHVSRVLQCPAAGCKSGVQGNRSGGSLDPAATQFAFVGPRTLQAPGRAGTVPG